MSFFKRLLNSKDALSSKRFISLVCLILLVAMVAKNLIGGVNVQPELIYIVGSLIAAGIGATLIADKNNSNNTPNI